MISPVMRCYGVLIEAGRIFHVVYRSLADTWMVYDNSVAVPQLLEEGP